MMTLARICGQHRHAVERDLLNLGPGYHLKDVGTKLTMWELVSVVVASPPNTAVFTAETRRDQGIDFTGTEWGQVPTPVDEQPYQRVKAAPQQQSDHLAGLHDYHGVKLNAYPPDELKRKREEIMERIRNSQQAKDREQTVTLKPIKGET